MNLGKTINQSLKFSLVLFCALNGISARSDEPVIIPAAPPVHEDSLLYRTNGKDKKDSYQYSNNLENPNPTMDSNSRNYESGKSRAQQMVNMLQNQELTKAFQKITNRSTKTLEDNPEIANPIGVIAGAASLWYGRTLKLIKGEDFNFSARMEGRAQRSEFSMNSPLLNGKLNFDAKEGIGIGFNRKIHELQTDAVILYNAKNQNISTELRKKIAPNLDLSFGASRSDQNTKIEYNLSF